MMVYGMPVDEGILDDIAVAYDAAYETVVKDFAAVYPEYSIHETAKSRADGRPDGNLIKALGRRSQVYTTKVDKEALNPYRHKPEISSLLTAKSVKTYCDYIHSVKASLRDGAVRGGYRQCAPQGRGRSTSGKGNIPSVNLQNPPNPSKACDEIKALKLPQVRSMFRAPAGYALGSTDYSAAHARIAAQTTQDEAFIASYVSNEDIHCHVASKLSELPKRNWSPEQISQYRKGKDDLAVLATQLRNIAKNEFYGWLNGAGAAKAADTATTGGFPATFDFGKEILHKLGSSFPGIKAFHDRVKHEIRTKIYKIDGVKIPYTRVRAICGRWVWLPVWPKDEGTGYGGAKLTDALIAHWMLTEATAIKLAMGKVRILSEQHPEWGVRIINLAHDELVWICLEPYFYTVHAAMEETMNSTMALFVTDIPVHEGYDPPSEVTYDWAAAH
jgi:DNA polymerase I-like protein with 3'-5' exonuclease and polymerase domains